MVDKGVFTNVKIEKIIVMSNLTRKFWLKFMIPNFFCPVYIHSYNSNNNNNTVIIIIIITVTIISFREWLKDLIFVRHIVRRCTKLIYKT